MVGYGPLRGQRIADLGCGLGSDALAAAREHHLRVREALPREAFALSRGDCAIETVVQ